MAASELLNRYTLQRRIEGSNPSVSASNMDSKLISLTFFTHFALCPSRCPSKIAQSGGGLEMSSAARTRAIGLAHDVLAFR
jgi:hypothetical protein